MKKIINSKKILLISLCLCFSLFLSTFFNKESDYFWHIKVGEYIFKHGILIKDIFSWSVISKYWMSHEWLFELFMYTLKFIFGNYSVVIYTFLSLMSIYLIIYNYNKIKMQNNMIFTLIWLAFSCLFIPYIQARPHFISFILFGLTLYLIFDLINNSKSKKIYFLPFITILWSNLHGGSSNLGYLLCFFTIIIGLFNFKCSKVEAKRLNKSQFIKLLVIGLLSIVCTGANPHGFKMTIYPYINLMDDTMTSAIAEWAPTIVTNMTHYPFFVMGIVILFILLFSKKKINFYHFALFGLGLYLGLSGIRFWPYLYIISSFFVFDYVSEFNLSTIKYIYIMTFICLFGIIIMSLKSVDQMVDKEYLFLNKKMINTIKKEKPKKLFNLYNTGGELIYHDIPVFIDGRADLYSSNKVLKQYLNIIFLDYDYEELIDIYDFDYYLVDSGSKIEKYIKKMGVEKIYQYKEFILYKKTLE